MGYYDDGGINEQAVNDDIVVTRFQRFFKANALASFRWTSRVTCCCASRTCSTSGTWASAAASSAPTGRTQRITRRAARSRHDPGRRTAGAVLMRRVLVQVHLWAGLALGLYIAVSSLTGAVLVFHEELGHAAQAALHRVRLPNSPAGDALTLDEAAAALRAALPAARILSLAPPHTPDGTFQAGVLAGGYRLAFVHPARARSPVRSLLAERSSAGCTRCTRTSCRAARAVSSTASAACCWCCSPPPAWSSGGRARAQWRRALLLKHRRRVEARDLRPAPCGGLLAARPGRGAVVTGAFFTWPAHYRTVIGWFSPVDTVPRAPIGPDAYGARTRAPSSRPWTGAPAMPGRHVSVGLPGQPVQPYTVFMARPCRPRPAR